MPLLPLRLATAAVPPAGTAAEPPPGALRGVARRFDRVTLAPRRTGTGATSCTVRGSGGDAQVAWLRSLDATGCALTRPVTRDKRGAPEEGVRHEQPLKIAGLVALRQPKAP